MPASTMQALVYAGLGVAEMKAGNSAPAAGDFDRAEAVLAGLSAEDHSMAWAMLADDEAKTNPERARKMLERMKDPMDQAARAAFIAGRFAQDGRVADARTFVAAAAALVNRAGGDPGAVSKRVGAESALAQAYGAIGDKKAGMEMLGKAAAGIAAEKNPSSLELLDLAIAEDRLGQTDDSDQTLAKVIDALPSDEKERTHVLWLMSEMLAFRGDVWDAADFIDKARVAHLGEEDAVYACVTAESLAKSDGEDAKLEWIDQMKDQAGAVIQRELYASAARGMVEAGENPKVRRFEAMAAAGDAEAMARLGAIFDAGLGVAKDMTAARSWYQKAAGAKDTEAADWLKAHPE
jgi:TPR repeat protein